jgi:hypothetical protein
MADTWVEKFSKTHQKKYWYNSKTKVSKWEDPHIPVITPAPQLNEEPKKESDIKSKTTLFDFLMECLRNEVNNEYVFDRRYDADYEPPNVSVSKTKTKTTKELEEDDKKEEKDKCKKDFAFYWITKVPYVVKEVDHDLGVVAIISLFDKNPNLINSLYTDPSLLPLKNSLCGFRPSFEFNLAAFAAFIGIQTPCFSIWRDTIWKTVYKNRYESDVEWNVNAETWNMISKVRVSLCISHGSKASMCFTREIQAFLTMISEIR